MGIRDRIVVVVSVASVLAGCAGAAPPESDDGTQPGQGKQHPGAPTNPAAGGDDQGAPSDPGSNPGTPRACRMTSTISDLASSPIPTSDPIYRISAANNALERSTDGGKTFAVTDAAETGSAAEFALGGKTLVVARSLGTQTAAGDDAYVLRKSTDGGKTWAPAGSFASNYPGKMTVGNGGEIYVVMVGVVGGKIGAVIHAVDAAGTESETMIEQAQPNVAVYGADVHVMQSGNVVAATYGVAFNNGNYNGASATFYSSTDSGKTWSQLTRNQVNSSNDISGINVTSDAAGNIYPAYVTAQHNKQGTSKLIVSKGTTSFVQYDTYTPPAGWGIWVGFTTSSVDKDGTLRLAWQEYPVDGGQTMASIKTVVRSIPASGTAANAEVKRTGSDYTYITHQRVTATGSVLLEGFGFSKSSNAVTETFELGFVCQ
jgi:photosystem II stability/assembly factor-like uncharacterized protein